MLSWLRMHIHNCRRGARITWPISNSRLGKSICTFLRIIYSHIHPLQVFITWNHFFRLQLMMTLCTHLCLRVKWVMVLGLFGDMAVPYRQTWTINFLPYNMYHDIWKILQWMFNSYFLCHRGKTKAPHAVPALVCPGLSFYFFVVFLV